MYYRTGGQYPVPMVIRTPYGGGIGGGLYHSQSIEATFAHVPGLKVVVPSNPYDAKGLLKSAIRDNNPVLFLEPKKGYRLIKGEVPDGDYSVPLGQAKVTREGTDITVYAYGICTLLPAAADEVARRASASAGRFAPQSIDKETVLNVQEDGQGATYLDNRFLGYARKIAAIR
jgi:2-oxoisovalerate dehydrogenase E1 component beta subunit